MGVWVCGGGWEGGFVGRVGVWVGGFVGACGMCGCVVVFYQMFHLIRNDFGLYLYKERILEYFIVNHFVSMPV